jgi:hypothetical protein
MKMKGKDTSSSIGLPAEKFCNKYNFTQLPLFPKFERKTWISSGPGMK